MTDRLADILDRVAIAMLGLAAGMLATRLALGFMEVLP